MARKRPAPVQTSMGVPIPAGAAASSGVGLDAWSQKENFLYSTGIAQASAENTRTDTPGPVKQTETEEDRYWQWRKAQDELEIRQAQDSLVKSIAGMFTEYGLSSLYDKIVEYVTAGYTGDAIALMLRQTPEYKQRFPAMEALSRKGRALSEAEYIAYERNAAQLERAYGLPEGMLGTDAITNLLTNEVSGDELQERVVMAAAGAFQAAPEVKETFSRYYGIDSGGLTAYFLDPEKALPLLNRQYVSSQIGAEAAKQDVVVAANTAEELYTLGVSQEQARQGFGQVAGLRGLTQGRGDVVTQQQLISGQFAQDESAIRDIERAARGRVGRFEGGGAFVASQSGVSGLGSAAT